MSHQEKSLLNRALTFILEIGADPQDTEYTRLTKRIFYVSTIVSLPSSLIVALLEFLNSNNFMALAFLLSSFIFLGFLVNGAIFPHNFERNAFYLLTYFILVSVLLTVGLGGFWRSHGIIMVGLLGPLYALLLPNKRRAFYLFGLYAMSVLILNIAKPFFRDSVFELDSFGSLIFWSGYLILVAFVFCAMYFFVVQRDKAYYHLSKEKEKSERLLRRIEKDLEEAGKIQKDLLPKENPNFNYLDITGTNIPCYQVGGDYYDFIPIDTDRLGVVIADVSGKGISASLLMASLRAALLAEIHPHYNLQRMAVQLNNFVFKSSPLNSFITFFYGEINVNTGEMFYLNAGHNPPLVVQNSGQFSNFESSGFALGMFPDVSFEPRRIRLKSGDIVVLFTDGIPEGRNSDREEYTEERLRNLIIDHRNLSVSQLSDKIFDDVMAFSAGAEQTDDITLVIIKQKTVLDA